MSALIKKTTRRARIRHHCSTRDYNCSKAIMPGELYLSIVIAPGHPDIGNRRWWRIAECEHCAGTCGRAIGATS